MKITKKRLQEIILEEMKMREDQFGAGAPQYDEDPFSSMNPPGVKVPRKGDKQEDPIQKRLNDIVDRMRRTLSTQLQTIDDPNEVIPFTVELMELLRELNPDLTNSEMDRVITMLRTKTLPDAQRSLKQGTQYEYFLDTEVGASARQTLQKRLHARAGSARTNKELK